MGKVERKDTSLAPREAAFVDWFRKRAASLLSVDEDQASSEIVERVREVDPRLSVEIGSGMPRELILSASGDPSLFDLVERVAAHLEADGWQIVALKPARGFDFTQCWDDHEVDAGGLRFEPLESAALPGSLGIRLYADRPHLVRECARSILETGVGERDATAIQHIEVSDSTSDEAAAAMPIAKLAEFLRWRERRRN